MTLQIVSSPSEDLQDYTYYFIPAPWLTIKLLKLLQSFIPSGEWSYNSAMGCISISQGGEARGTL